MDIIRIILAILPPPLGVFLQFGIGLHFWINSLLTILGYITAIIQCAPMARFTSGGRIHPGSCR